MFSLLELRFSGDKVRSVCDQLSVMEDLVLINHVWLPHLLHILSYRTLRHVNICVLSIYSYHGSGPTGVQLELKQDSGSVCLFGSTGGVQQGGSFRVHCRPGGGQSCHHRHGPFCRTDWHHRGPNIRAVPDPGRQPIRVNVRAIEGSACYPSRPAFWRGSVWRWTSGPAEFWSLSEEV